MNFLMSINSKMFSQYDSLNLMNVITNLDVNNSVKGIEIYIDMINEEEKEYCLSLAKVIKDKNLIMQVHSVDMNNLKENSILEYLEYYNKLSLIYGKQVKLTVHSLEENTLEESIKKSIKILKSMMDKISENNFNLEVLLENLNEHREVVRCNIYEVYKIIDSVELDGITLDMGHYVYDNSNDYSNLDNKYTNKIKNIHLHDISGKEDHHPFYYNSVKIKEAMDYLKKIGYNENVVLEFGLEYLKGETFKDKIDEYIKQIEYVNSQLYIK
ncbi:MAG: Xylose isomerase-like barrel [Clostridia bacterium]|nr:Xylose isomerase-like barrel [Clostridia bacterium]